MLAVHPQSVLLHSRESHHTGIFTLVARAVIRFLCALRGHELVWHFEPDRLSLGCLKCGMNTPGWTIDVNPALRRRAPAGAQVLPNRTRDKAA
jgi:hypothetical protein